MSQNQLAFEAGVTREFVNKVESGNYNISLKNLEKLALILEVEVKDLFDI
jgi:transcriptional regulator with XRE-family HTH domain